MGLSPEKSSSWYLYLLECRGGATYAGITTDVERRFNEHCSGKGAKYTRANPPVKVIGVRGYKSRSDASVAECLIKRMRPAAKRDFITGVTS